MADFDGDTGMQIVVDDSSTNAEQDPWENFTLPFPVGTLEEFGQRCYFNEEGAPEWLWSRVHAYLHIQKDSWLVLHSNKENINQHLVECQVDTAEFRYRPRDGTVHAAKWKDHTFLSRALLAMLVWTAKNRPLPAHTKHLSMKLLFGLASKAHQYMCQLFGDSEHRLAGMVISKHSGALVTESLSFSKHALCFNWDKLLSHSPGAQRLWGRLRKQTWCGYCISTTLDQASIQDILLFLSFICAHKTLSHDKQNLWIAVGSLMLPLMLQLCGNWLDSLAFNLSQQRATELPLLKTKMNRVSRALDPVNRMVLLYKLRKEKVMRRRVSLSHEGLVPLEAVWSRHEACLDVALHIKALQSEFDGHPPQISICWDPTSYGGKSTNVSVFWSNHLSKGGFCLNQQVAKVMQSDVGDDIPKAAKDNKISRVEGYSELRGFASALWHTTGMSLEDFQVPEGLCLWPLSKGQVRLKGTDGKHYVVNLQDNTYKPVIPHNYCMGDIPLLNSVSDQGPLPMAALSYLGFSANAIMLHPDFDPFHRSWNDIKGAAKKSSFGAWRCILELVVFFNLNFGPFQSHQWFWRKRAMLEQFLASETWRGETWSNYAHLISQEQRREEPFYDDDKEVFFNQLTRLQNCICKGGCVKLLRWFSLFEACADWQGQMWMTKMVMEHGLKAEGDMSDDEAAKAEDLHKSNAANAKEQLAELKRRKGTFKLGPSLVNPKNMAIKDILVGVCRASWKIHAERTREMKSPDDYLQHAVACAGRAEWKHELVAIVENSLFREELLQHLFPEWSTHSSALEWHTEFFLHLLSLRAMSLASFHTLPPVRYSHVLSRRSEESSAGQKKAVEEFASLLRAENAALELDVAPLKLMFWAKNPVARALFLAHEEDEEFSTANAKKLHTIISRGMKDTRMVGNAHQFGRDLLRSSMRALETLGS